MLAGGLDSCLERALAETLRTTLPRRPPSPHGSPPHPLPHETVLGARSRIPFRGEQVKAPALLGGGSQAALLERLGRSTLPLPTYPFRDGKTSSEVPAGASEGSLLWLFRCLRSPSPGCLRAAMRGA